MPSNRKPVSTLAPIAPGTHDDHVDCDGGRSEDQPQTELCVTRLSEAEAGC